MARRQRREAPTSKQELVPLRDTCESCGGTLWMAYRSVRTITTLDGVCQLHLTIRRCHNRACPRYRQPYRPEEEGRWALPHGEFGLDVIAFIGTLRYEKHHSVPEIHHALCKRGVVIAERTVTNLLARYEELVTLRLSNRTRLCERLATQGQVILALDGLQPVAIGDRTTPQSLAPFHPVNVEGGVRRIRREERDLPRCHPADGVWQGGVGCLKTGRHPHPCWLGLVVLHSSSFFRLPSDVE